MDLSIIPNALAYTGVAIYSIILVEKLYTFAGFSEEVEWPLMDYSMTVTGILGLFILSVLKKNDKLKLFGLWTLISGTLYLVIRLVYNITIGVIYGSSVSVLLTIFTILLSGAAVVLYILWHIFTRRRSDVEERVEELSETDESI